MSPQRLAGCVDALHGVVNFVWVGGFVLWLLELLFGFLSGLRLPHYLFVIAVFLTLVAFGWKCPLTIIAQRLRERAEPQQTVTKAVEPFVAGWMKRLGIPITDQHVTIITLVGTAVVTGALAHAVFT